MSEVAERPEIVCLCGSMRFVEEFRAAQRELGLAGVIVVAPVESGLSGEALTEERKALLGELHLRKIDVADRVVVINPGGYVGESTKREIAHARAAGKSVTFTHPA